MLELALTLCGGRDNLLPLTRAIMTHTTEHLEAEGVPRLPLLVLSLLGDAAVENVLSSLSVTEEQEDSKEDGLDLKQLLEALASCFSSDSPQKVVNTLMELAEVALGEPLLMEVLLEGYRVTADRLCREADISQVTQPRARLFTLRSSFTPSPAQETSELVVMTGEVALVVGGTQESRSEFVMKFQSVCAAAASLDLVRTQVSTQPVATVLTDISL